MTKKGKFTKFTDDELKVKLTDSWATIERKRTMAKLLEEKR